MTNQKWKTLLAGTAISLVALYSSTAMAQAVQTKSTVVTHETTTRTGPVVTTSPRGQVIVAPAVVAAPVVGQVVVAPGVAVVPGVRTYRFLDFDLNNDLILSTTEVGEKLFKLYDTNDNNVIDNVEYDHRVALTVQPIEQNVTVSYDLDGDGIADKVTTTSNLFFERSRLSLFDKNGDGLSAHEFTGRSFLEADINDDKSVDLSEWKGSYIASIDEKNKAKAYINE